jgi:anthranilate synthase/aminodeoxychorismate synthase-like glutamine amidotransferase
MLEMVPALAGAPEIFRGDPSEASPARCWGLPCRTLTRLRSGCHGRTVQRVLVIDNYDSFTYNLVQCLEALGATCDVRLNDRVEARDVVRTMPHGVVISPGPGGPETAGATLAVIREAAGRIPLLGVCLGHQAIGHHFGAQVRRAKRPVHGKAHPVEHDAKGVFRSLPSPFEAARYHSLVVDEDTVPECLTVTARTPDGEVMGLRHRSAPIEGVQFHPESILSEHGPALLRNWLETL